MKNLHEKLIRPLKVGDVFKVSKDLTLNYSMEMVEFEDKWVDIIDVQQSSYTLDSDEKDTFRDRNGACFATAYIILQVSARFDWFVYHINIYETNLALIKKDSLIPCTLSLPKLPFI